MQKELILQKLKNRGGRLTKQRLMLLLDSKLKLISKDSFWNEVKKYSLSGKIAGVLMKGLNNRLTIYAWESWRE